MVSCFLSCFMVIFRIINIRIGCVLYFFPTTLCTLRHTMLQLAVTHHSPTMLKAHHLSPIIASRSAIQRLSTTRSRSQGSTSKKVPQKLLHSATNAAENCSYAGSASKFAEHCGGMKCTTKTETDTKSNSCRVS